MINSKVEYPCGYKQELNVSNLALFLSLGTINIDSD